MIREKTHLCASICGICGRIFACRMATQHSTSHIPHPSFHTFKRPLVHEGFAKVGSLLALDAFLHLTRFGGVGNHADGVRNVINGKNVVAPIREIQEVKNAIKTYEMYPHLDAFKEEDLLKAHAQMMEAIIDNPGRYRHVWVHDFWLRKNPPNLLETKQPFP